jgi:phosphohistidine phosphatase
MAPATHRLLLMRHAQAVDGAGALGDHERPLTEYGIEQAEAAGEALRARGTEVDMVLCSDALRTRQTWAALGIDAECEPTREVYNAGSDTLLELIRLLDEEVGTAMIIGHSPGLPALAVDLAGPDSDVAARDTVNSHYPTATLTEFEIAGTWAELQIGRLSWLRLGSARPGS